MRLELNETEKMASRFDDEIRKRLGDRMGGTVLSDISDTPHYRTFTMRFLMYDYIHVYINYTRGAIACSVRDGDCYVFLKNSQKEYSKMDIDQFVEELQQEVKLRIPDKYLKAHGYM